MTESPSTAFEIDNRPLVSVCITTYQHEKYIGQCLEGILSQETGFEYEVIVGEDGSNDNTLSICESYQKKSKVKITILEGKRSDVIHIHGNPTGRANLIKCISSAKGKYIALCEGDDYWIERNKLSKQVEYMESNPDCIMCFHNAEIHYEDEDRIVLFNKQKMKSKYYTDDVFGPCFIPTASMLFRNIEEFTFPAWFSKVASGDIALAGLLSEYGYLGYNSDVMSLYRKHGTGISNTHRGEYMLWSRLQLFQYLNKHFDKKYNFYFLRECKNLVLGYVLSFPLWTFIKFILISCYQRAVLVIK